MIEKVIHAYRSGAISLEDMFVALARNSGKKNWSRVFGSLPKEEQESFREWAVPLLTGKSILIVCTGHLAIEDSQLETLRDRAKEAGWSL